MSEDLISREKAYEVLTEYYHHKTEMQHKALREALDRVPSAELQPTCNQLATSCNQLATDCISRQAAIEAMWKLRRGQQMLDDTQTADIVMQGIFLAEQRIKNLPSVDVHDRKVGKWLEKEVIHAEEAKEVITEWQSCKCSVCGCYDTRPYLYCFNEPRFCSWCGAEMKGEDE